MFELSEISGGKSHAKIKVFGVGGAGGNVINNMIASNITSVDFVAVNTDAQALENSLAHATIQVGAGITRGLGAGSRPELGKEAALEDKEKLMEAVEGCDMVFITAGMGGGTGTGAAPVIAELAKNAGALTVGVVTKPFFYEGGTRKKNAEYGIREMKDKVDTLIVIPNDRIAMVVDKGTTLLESFNIANNVLKNAVRGISDLIVVPGLINLDFADVKTIVQDAGRAVIGMGVGKGETGANEAAKRAILNPLLENSSIEGCEGIIINITGGPGLTLHDVQEATSSIYDQAHKEANIIMGAVIDPELKDEVRVTVIATKFKDAGDLATSESKREAYAQAPASKGRPVQPIAAEPERAAMTAFKAQVAEAEEAIEAELIEEVAARAEADIMEAAMPVAEPVMARLPLGEPEMKMEPVMAHHSAKPKPRRPSALPTQSSLLKGAERVLAKTLAMESPSIASRAAREREESSLDVPTFLRKALMGEGRESRTHI